MKKIIKKTLVFALLCLVFVLSSCSKTSKTDNSITIWWPAGKQLQTIINDAIVRFKSTNPDVEINVVKKAGLDIYDVYRLALNDNNSRPDVVIIDHVYVQALAFEDQLLDLKGMGSDKDVKPLVPENIYNANAYADGIYGLPFSANTVALMYNKDILKDCGINNPPTTFDELLEDCQIVENKGYKAFAQPINDTFVAMEFASYVSRVGGSMISDDYKTVKLNSSEVKNAVDKWASLSKYANQNEYEEGQFYNGKVAFIEMGSWNLSKVSGTSSLFDCGVSEMVSIDSSIPNYSGLGLYSLVVSKQSNNQELAYKFAKFLSTDKEVQLAFAKEKDLFPVTNESLEDEYYTSNQILNVFANQLSKVSARPGTPIWPTMERQIVNMLYSAVKASTEDEILNAINIAQSNCQSETDRKYKK